MLAPCAAGGLIDDALARSIDCRVVAGAANNPLTDRGVARTLMERDILYVPDFLANCGGLIHVAVEWSGGGSEQDFIAGAMERLDVAIETAESEGTTPIEVAERQALERVEAARGKIAAWPPCRISSGWFGELVRARLIAPYLRGGRRADRRADQVRRPARGRPPAVRARAGLDHADQPPDAPRGRQDARRGRRARGAPRPVRRDLRRLRADPARPAPQPPGDPRERGGGRARGTPPARAARGPARRGARERGGLRRHGGPDRAQAHARGRGRLPRERGPLPPARPQVPPGDGARHAQLDRRSAHANPVPPARDRTRHGRARPARAGLGDLDPRAHARRRSARPTSR